MTSISEALQNTYRGLMQHGMPEPDTFHLFDGKWVAKEDGHEINLRDARDLLEMNSMRWWLFEDDMRTVTVSEPNQVVVAWANGADMCECSTVASAILRALERTTKSAS